MLGFNDKLLNFVYPIGSYYETSDSSFNPNTSWGGTWVEDSKGRVLVALDENDVDFNSIGKTGGSKELQEHTHNIVLVRSNNVPLLDTDAGPSGYNGNNAGVVTNSGAIQPAGTGDSGNLQPYIVAKRWHRIA